MQLVVFRNEWSDSFEAFNWEQLGVSLLDAAHSLMVDILLNEDFAEDAEAMIQAHIPNAMVRLHTVPNADRPVELDGAIAIEKFWRRIDSASTVTG